MFGAISWTHVSPSVTSASSAPPLFRSPLLPTSTTDRHDAALPGLRAGAAGAQPRRSRCPAGKDHRRDGRGVRVCRSPAELLGEPGAAILAGEGGAHRARPADGRVWGADG